MLLFLYNYTLVTFSDSLEPWGLFFQDNATPQMEDTEGLHNDVMFYLSVTLFAVSLILPIVLNKAKLFNEYTNHGTLVELIWTITPISIIVLIAFPSFRLLYLMDEIIDPSLVIYGEDPQWYWSYQYPDFTKTRVLDFLEFDSYIVPDNHLYTEKFLLEADDRVIIPELTHANLIKFYYQLVKFYSQFLFLENYLFLNSTFDNSPEFEYLLFQDSASESSSISELSPLEEARQNSINSNENLREAKFNVHFNQANTFDLIERVVNRELSDRASSTFSDINNDRQDATNEINRKASRATINATTESGRALIEAQAGFFNMVVQQLYLNQGCSVVQDCGANFTMNEQNQSTNYLNENARLWVEYRQAYIQHVNNLNTQISLDPIDISRDGNIRRTSLVQEYANTTSDTSDSE